jgi:hypothetical protein
MKKFHISVSVGDFNKSVDEYSEKLGCLPEVVVDDRYALWRNEILNFSISKKAGQEAGIIRHIGFEDPSLNDFSEEQDCNNITWEFFDKLSQQKEIKDKFGI